MKLPKGQLLIFTKSVACRIICRTVTSGEYVNTLQVSLPAPSKDVVNQCLEYGECVCFIKTGLNTMDLHNKM